MAVANSSNHYRQLTEQESMNRDQVAKLARSGASFTDASLLKLNLLCFLIKANFQVHFRTS